MIKNCAIALLLALVLGVLPDYAERLGRWVSAYVCERQSAALRAHEFRRWTDERFSWHVDLVRADGVTRYDHRHECLQEGE